jgi:hypothetical protein
MPPEVQHDFFLCITRCEFFEEARGLQKDFSSFLYYIGAEQGKAQTEEHDVLH